VIKNVNDIFIMCFVLSEILSLKEEEEEEDEGKRRRDGFSQ
jgi:hypothetical protein